MSTLLFELRLAWRSLLRTPAFTLTATLMLCAGLSACLYVFGAIESFLLRPLPLTEPERLLHVEYTPQPGEGRGQEIGLRVFLDLERQQTALSSLAGYSGGTINLSDEVGRPERYDGIFAIGDLFESYGVPAMLGRTLSAADQQPGAQPAVLIGYQLWQQRFAADRDVVGRTIRVNGKPSTIVGVMPNGFRFPFNNQVWVPLSRVLPEQPREEDVSLRVLGRMQPDASMADVSAELSRLMADVKRAHPDSTVADSVSVQRYQDRFVGRQTRQILFTMLAAVVLVLLIACANVANLLFARAAARSRDVAVRSALGATRWRLAIGMMAESLMIAMLAAPPAVLLAHWGGLLTMDALRAGEDPPPFWMTSYHLDIWFVVAAIGFASLAGVVAGLLPGLRLARGSTAQVIRDGSAALTAGKAGRVLVVAEIAMSLALLVTTGLMVRGILNLQGIDIGARTGSIMTARYGLFDTQASDDASVAQHQQRVLTALREVPGIESATLTTSLPMANTSYINYYVPEGEAIDDPQRGPLAYDVSVDPDFFNVFGIGLQSGRLFDSRDQADAPPVAIISRALAERHWPGEDPLGRRLRMERADKNEQPWITVVGVVGEVQLNGEHAVEQQTRRPAIYRPISQAPARFVSLAVSTTLAPDQAADAMRDAMREVDIDTPLYWVRSMESWVYGAATDQRLVGMIFSAFGAFSLILASAGLYAVLAFSVSQRTREIGVRRALGASASNILRLVIGQGMRQVAWGLLLGLPLALGFGFALSGILYQVSSADPLTYSVVLCVFGLVAMVASALPGRRALRVEPSEALRYG